MFLHLSVILFTGGLCPGGSLYQGGSLSTGVSVQRGASMSRGSLLSGDLYPGGSLSRGICPRSPAWYASYWNGFLLCFALNFISLYLS